MLIFLLLLSFLLGSVPSAYLIVKTFCGIDIREHGSGNPGTTNVWRTAGRTPGALTLILDVLKGLIPILVAKNLYADQSLMVPMLAGCCAIAGHIWSPFLKFKGGKGVATSFGVFLGLTPLASFLALVIFVIVFLTTKYVSLGSMSAAISLPIFMFFLKEPAFLKDVSAVLAVIVIWRHKSNIKKFMGIKEE